MKTISIRLAEESDINTLCDLYYEFHEFHAHHLPDYLRTLGNASANEREELRNKIIEMIQGSDSDILVAEGSGRVLGFAEIYLRRPDPKNPAVVPK